MRSILVVVMIAFSSCVQIPGVQTSGAQAHDAPSGWAYEPYCCNGDNETGDCQMIPPKSVAITPNGYRVTLLPGDHRLVTHAHVFLLPMGRAMKSGDGDYHLCLFPNEDTPRCFYAPEMGY
ncbi:MULTISPECIES: hypothetical protein [unclassified Rhizobium]|uniref:hypothetical protein n=1 Tax=unclassified Rhizobium TaxID=2613769 RepID=UPI000DDAD326|nr:hypothetical protein [Rhizobium sp. UBA1881]